MHGIHYLNHGCREQVLRDPYEFIHKSLAPNVGVPHAAPNGAWHAKPLQFIVKVGLSSNETQQYFYFQYITPNIRVDTSGTRRGT
jgi:hypothetical protein